MSANVWGTDPVLINADEFCPRCEREVPGHYTNCDLNQRRAHKSARYALEQVELAKAALREGDSEEVRLLLVTVTAELHHVVRWTA